MDNIQDSSIFEFNIDEEGRSNISAIAQWANISAIVGFVGIAVSIVSFAMALGKVSGNANSSTALVGSGIGELIGLAISLVLNITLLSAASNLKKGIDLSNQGFFGAGLTKLASYFKIVGILTIIAIVLLALVLLVVVLAGGANN